MENIQEEQLINDLITNQITMISEERFKCIRIYKNEIESIDGDIVECGVWRGGMSIYLSKLFEDKTIWVCDSFEGCQDPEEGKYTFNRETHSLGMYACTLEEVQENFKKYNAFNPDRVKFLKGWVRDTLLPKTCSIKKISLLRVDVDSYSATLEVLDYLYDKVSTGGMIIFDDISGIESATAIRDFMSRGYDLEIRNPFTHELEDVANSTGTHPSGCYCFKK
jgi:O-methyltransferase